MEIDNRLEYLDDADIPKFDELEVKQDNYIPPQYVTQNDVVGAIIGCETLSKHIRFDQKLKNSLWSILKAFYLDGKQYYIGEFPTGSGKTIIGYCVHFCTTYLDAIEYAGGSENENFDFTSVAKSSNTNSYYLTSNKALQDQIEKDTPRFKFTNHVQILKGVKNYECIAATDKFAKEEQGRTGFAADVIRKTKGFKFKDYGERLCMGLKLNECMEEFPKCAVICPYRTQRSITTETGCAVLNYHYFLNVLKSYNPFFGVRNLTICDEAHLLPDIICDMYNFEFSVSYLYKINNFLLREWQDSAANNLSAKLYNIINFFKKPLYKGSDIYEYMDDIVEFRDDYERLGKRFMPTETEIAQPDKRTTFEKEMYPKYSEFLSGLNTQVENLISLKELIRDRNEDLYFESTKQQKSNDFYTHVFKDLDESNLSRKHFLKKVNRAIFMSATIGDGEEFAKMMGMPKDSYRIAHLPSDFDFDQSPIYMCNVAYFNAKNKIAAQPKIINAAYYIAENLHPTEKGIIHTVSNENSRLFEEFVTKAGRKERYLFYNDGAEKEEMLEILKKSTKPLVIVGASLYEGLDLKDDLGRFNILMKTPYKPFTTYVRRKTERFPFWYKRDMLEKMVQAFGRTNRHKNDYSTVYVLDCCSNSVIYELDQVITDRLKTLKLN